MRTGRRYQETLNVKQNQDQVPVAAAQGIG
jgi:hypothetical protein